jgi:ADP-ribosylglycohydrolase
MNTRADRFAGCLLGLAVGDALAAPFEGIDAYAIHPTSAGRRPSSATRRCRS